MSATKPADLTLAIQKATEGFTAIIDRPTDTDIINIRQFLVSVLMKTKYDEINLKHNLSSVIIATDRYQHIYLQGPYTIPPIVRLYDDTIARDATRTEVNQAEESHCSKRNDRALYEMANTECLNFIMEVVNKTWYKELEDPDMFYTNVSDLQLLEHLTEFCAGLHAVNAVNIPTLMKTLFADAEGIPKFINVMEAAHTKSKQADLEVSDNYMHAVALKSLLATGEYETETRDWTKLPKTSQIWTA